MRALSRARTTVFRQHSTFSRRFLAARPLQTILDCIRSRRNPVDGRVFQSSRPPDESAPPGVCRPEPRPAAGQREQGGMRFLDFLMDEHRAFGTMLGVLDSIAAKLARGNDVPLDMLADVVDFFERFSNQHHAQEEHLLFPLLAKHGIGADQTVVSALTAQHEAGRMYGAKMRVEVGLMRDGASGVAAAFASDAAAYSELIREHIRIEDEYFYALADQVLTPAEHERIADRLERAASDPATHASRVRYLGMLETYRAVVAGWAAER